MTDTVGNPTDQRRRNAGAKEQNRHVSAGHGGRQLEM
jgi:hypothetical protein